MIGAGVDEALALLPAPLDSLKARVMLLAIGWQESLFKHRCQVLQDGSRGPAHGFWQFERGGGCTGVLRHAASRYWMHHICGIRGVAPVPMALWKAIEYDDTLAAAAARLLLFTDPKRLPEIGDQAGAWNLYIRVWRPGKPHPSKWQKNYANAVDFVATPKEPLI